MSNKQKKVILITFIILSIYYFFMIPTSFETTHIVGDANEDLSVILPGNVREYIYNAEAGFNRLYLCFMKSDVSFSIQIKDLGGRTLIDGTFNSVDATLNLDSGGYELEVLNSEKTFGSGIYKVVISNNDPDESFSVAVMSFNHDYISLRSFDFSYIGRIIALFCMILMTSLLYFVLFKTELYQKKPEIIFLYTSIALVIVNIIIFLPWDCLDSESHFPAIYRLSNMIINGKDNEWLVDANDEFVMNEFTHRIGASVGSYDRMLNKLIGTESNVYIEYDVDQRRMSFYSILSYLPQVLGLSIARTIGFGAMSGIYLGRFLMGFFYIWGCHRAIKKMPFCKMAIAMICLLPFPLIYSTAISYDAMLFVVSILFIAVSSDYSVNKNDKCVPELMLWAFMLGGVKAGAGLVLIPFVFLVGIKNKKIKLILPVLMALVSVILFDVILPDGAFFQLGGADGAYLSTSFMFLHPAKYLLMVLRTYFYNSWDMLKEMMLYKQDHFMINIFSNIYDLFLYKDSLSPVNIINVFYRSFISVFLLLVLFFFSIDERIKNKIKLYSTAPALVCICISLLFTPALLLGDTKSGSGSVNGVQGRYYLIVLPVFCIFLVLSKSRIIYKITDYLRTKISDSLIETLLTLFIVAIMINELNSMACNLLN